MTGARRQPQRPERVRDAERSRTALLDAALSEFAENGFAGARVEAIATRAGLNKQLISYYFGGKRGLYDAITERRQSLTREKIDTPETSFVDLVLGYFYVFQDQPEMQRLFLQETFEQDPSDVAYEPDNADVNGLRDRQRAGEIGAEFDPAFLLLFLQAMGVTGAIFSREAKRLTGLDSQSAEFKERAADQLSKIVERLT